jgi:hypothetical protein
MVEAQSILDSLGIWVGSAVVATLFEVLLQVAIHKGWLEKLGINRPGLQLAAPPTMPVALSPDEANRSKEALIFASGRCGGISLKMVDAYINLP